MLRRFIRRLRVSLLRPRYEREMQEEMRVHLEQATARLRARGLSEMDARAAARREFGSIDQIKESARDARGGRWLEGAAADARYALRQFRRTPWSAATMLLLLALGIGANSALFTLLHSMRTQPPQGIPRDEKLVRIRGVDRSRFSGGEVAYPEVLGLQAHQDVFDGVAAWTSTGPTLDVGDIENGIIAGTATYVTDGYFDVLGVRPALGRVLQRNSSVADGSALIAVISAALWERHYGSRSDILGSTLKVNDVVVTIVGVGPPRFKGADNTGQDRRVWMPLAARSIVERSGTGALSSHDSTLFRVVARLAPDVAADAALPAVHTIAARASAAMTRPPTGGTADIVPLLANNIRPRSGGGGLTEGMAFSAFTLLTLLVTCTNVSTLLVGIAWNRRREIAVRLSLGAARRRIVRQLLTESVLLALTAASIGILLMWALIRAYSARIPDTQLLLQWPTLLFTAAFAIGTGVVFGLSPALHATRFAVSDVLKDSAASVSSSRSLLQRVLVVAQIALTQPLLVGLGATVLIVLSALYNAASTPSEHIAVLSFDAYAGNTTVEQRTSDIRALTERLAAMPGVIGSVPLRSGYGIDELAVHAADRGNSALSHETFRIRTNTAPPGYFALMGIPFVRGRDFEPSEYQSSYASIIIGNDLARRLWGAADPIGRRLIDSDSSTLVVVGVVDDTKAGGSDVGNELRIFVPSWSVVGSSQIYVRTSAPAEPMISAIRQVARATVPQMPVRGAETLAAQEAAERRFILRVSMATAAGGLLALLLSAIGLYAVVAFAVGQRTREIGIRAALGARTREIVNMFFVRGMRLSLLGLAIGLPLSLIALRLISAQMGVRSVNALWLAAGVACFVLIIAALATWIPARRAASVDPLQAIRAE